jgi:hypothetical protein
MATCEGCCHLTGAMLNLAAEAADRARIGVHLLSHAALHEGATFSTLMTCLAVIILAWVTAQSTSMPGAVRRCTRILWPTKASEKTRGGVIPPVCVKSF